MEKATTGMNFGNRRKIITLGEIGTGKTSLLRRIHNGNFCEDQVTIADEFAYKAATIDGQNFQLMFWGKFLVSVKTVDTAGQERYSINMTPMYYRNTSAVIFVVDISSRSSLEKIEICCENYQYFLQNFPPQINQFSQSR